MTLLEVLILGVGAGIAKGVLKLWLRDSPVAEKASASILDIIKSKTQDLLAQRSANRQFEQICERVAKSVLGVFDAEEVPLDDGAKVAVARAAGETVKRMNVTPELLAKRNLDPNELTRLLSDLPTRQAIADPTVNFSEAETALYHRVLSESAQCMVDIASQLPSFTERTFAEVLKREDLLLKRADLILTEIGRIRDGLDTQDIEAAAFEEKYRRAVIRRLDELQLFGVDVSATSKRYRLSVAYVTLQVERSGPAMADGTGEAEKGVLLDDGAPFHEDGHPGEEDYSETIPVDVALARSPRLFVRGPAGSGKTTLLQWLAVMGASRSLAEELADWNDRVPFFVRLRQYADKPLPGPQAFPSLASSVLSESMPDGWAEQRLRSGRAMVLVDGLDEIPRSRRKEVRQWLGDLVDAFEEARFVVSTRPHAADEGWLAGEGFLDAELLEMGREDIAAFIDHWHEAVKEGVQADHEKDRLEELRKRLKQIVRKNRAIHKLATSPLLCAMLCALHRDRQTQLPSDRIELYRACCDMFLRRDLERGVSLSDYRDIGDRQKRSLLEDFAYWLIRNGWTEVDEGKADKRFQQKLNSLQNIPPGTAGSDVRRLFVERSGVLREPVPGQVDFSHRTFQEYLAARAAVEGGDFGELVKNAHDDQWREVVILAAGLARTAEANALVREVLERGDRSRAQRHRLFLLAVGCLETMLEPTAGVKRRVEERLSKIVPPQNMTEAKELASAGELVVPHLAYDSEYTAKQAAACIRTLALVGGEHAIALLEAFTRDSRTGVGTELSRSARSCADPELYLTQVAGRVRNLSVSIESARGLLTLLDFTGLESLSLSLSAYIVDDLDLSPLANLPRLQSLSLSACHTGDLDLSPLVSLPRLQSLSLSSLRDLPDLSALASLTRLQSLSLSGGEIGRLDLSPLANLPCLQSLSLSLPGNWMEQIGMKLELDLSPLADLASLRSLDLRWARVSDAATLRQLRSRGVEVLEVLAEAR